MIVYLDFMPSFEVLGVKWGCLFVPTKSRRPLTLGQRRRCRYVLFDPRTVDLRHQIDVRHYALYVNMVVRGLNEDVDIVIVVPSSSDSMSKTVELYNYWTSHYGRKLEVKYDVKYALVLHELNRLDDWLYVLDVLDPDIVVVPCRRINSIECWTNANLCATYVLRVLKTVRRPVHLLATNASLLRKLKQWDLLYAIRSIDIQSPRLKWRKERDLLLKELFNKAFGLRFKN